MDILGIDRAGGPTEPPGLIVQRHSGEVVRLTSGSTGVREDPYPLHSRFGALRRGEPDPCPGFEPIVTDGESSIEDNAASWYVAHAGALSGPGLDPQTAKELAGVLALETQPAGASLLEAVHKPGALAAAATEMHAPISPRERARGLVLQRARYAAARAGTGIPGSYDQLGVPEVDRVLSRGRSLLQGIIENTGSTS